VKHFKTDLRFAEQQRRDKRDTETAVFHPSRNVFDPLRRSDGAAPDAQPSAVTRTPRRDAWMASKARPA
jgi:hypothetical protein